MYLHFMLHDPENLGTAKNSKYNGKYKRCTYYKIFNESFHLSFGKPRSDTCETCDEFKSKLQLNDVNTSELQAANKAHVEKANLGYETLKLDMKKANDQVNTNNSIDLITFDFMQNIACPSLTHSQMFYSRQLWCYCFGISNRLTQKPFFYIWDESR